jgi:Spy/CpxP family protein refolding chaperone
MNIYRNLLLACCVALFALAGLAASSPAAPSPAASCCDPDGPPRGTPGHDAMRNLPPEARDSLRKAGEALMPVLVQYQAKMAELHAKIYSGADDKTLQELAKEVERLHSQLLEGRIALQKQRARLGLPMRGVHRGMMGDMTDCPGGMRGPGGMR